MPNYPACLGNERTSGRSLDRDRGSIWRMGQTLLETSGEPVQKISDLKPSTSVKGPARIFGQKGMQSGGS